MIIEVSKKQLLIIGVIVAVFLCIGGGYALYSFGYSSGYEDGHSSGVAETQKKYENPKGDGSVWYAETINNGSDKLYHSTSACPFIRNGIKMNWGFTNPRQRKQHSQFCPKCMDSYLIRMCEAYLYTDEEWN